VEFKREVYVMALNELSHYLPRSQQRNRFLRQGIRPMDAYLMYADAAHGPVELPPGGSYEPDSQSGMARTVG